MARRRDGFTGGLIALVMATVLLPVRPGSAQTNWVSYTPPAGWFQVDMPLMPTASQVQDTSPIGSITTHIFAANEGGATFSVSCSELPTLAVQFLGADVLMEQAKNSILRQQNARERSFEPATINGLSGKRLVYETTTNGGKRTGQAFLTLHGSRLYILDTVVPEGSEALVHKFFQSFRLKN
jgi:hypothetical protein